MKTVLSDRIKKAGTVLLIPLDLICLNNNRPRKIIDDKKLCELADSIKYNGIIQPLVVRKLNDKFELISGERRFRAAQMLSLDNVPCIIMSVSEQKSILFSLIENSQRVNLEFTDEAYAFNILNTIFNIEKKEISEKLGKSDLYLSSRIDYISLSDDMKQIISDNNLSENYILSLCKLKTDFERYKFLEYVTEKQLNLNNNDKTEETVLIKKPVIKFNKLNNIKIFINTLNHTVETMRKAGINADITQSEQTDCFEYVIRIPKMTSSPVRLVDVTCNVV